MKLGIVMMLIASLSVSSFKHSFKSCNSADISRKSNNANKRNHKPYYSISRKSNKSNNANKRNHKPYYSISRKSNKSNRATKRTHNANY